MLRMSLLRFSCSLRRTFFRFKSFRVGAFFFCGYLFQSETIFLRRKNGRGERIGWALPKSFGPTLCVSLLRSRTRFVEPSFRFSSFRMD